MVFWKRKAKQLSPVEDPNSFGNIAREMGYIDNDTLEKAVQLQERRVPLGEILITMGVLTLTERDEILFEQKRRAAKNNTAKSIIELERQRSGITNFSRNIEQMTQRSEALANLLKK